MKLHKRYVVIILVMTIALALSAQAAGKRKKIFSPAPGVLCDQYICADAQHGVSDKLTERYLGHAQVRHLRKMGKFNRQSFTLANGIHCDINDKKCYVDRYFDTQGQHSAVSQQYTQLLFGK